MSDKRAIRDFSYAEDPWPVASDWASHQGFQLVEDGETRRVYKKGKGVLTAARMLELRRSDGQLHLEAWVYSNLAARLMSLFILPSEITIESGGFKASVPRKQGRGEVGELLSALGQPPIG